MFLHLSVSHSVHGGCGERGIWWKGVCPGGRGVVDTLPPGPRGRHPLDPEADTPGPRGKHPWTQRQTLRPPLSPVEMATEAGGTHPTGMHSCIILKLITDLRNKTSYCCTSLSTQDEFHSLEFFIFVIAQIHLIRQQQPKKSCRIEPVTSWTNRHN